MTVYISGPMSSVPGHNVPAFNWAAKKWRQAGWDVKNPADTEGMPEYSPETRHLYLRRDVQMILDSDAVAVLTGWDALDTFARTEVNLARAFGMPVYDALTMEAI